jgi:hypothetical protein
MGIANLIGLMDDLIDELAYPSPRENRTGIPDTLKRDVEVRSGYSLDDVRVHYHSDKPAHLDAAAYTQGRDIYVASGAEAHLAHEVWHAVQQKMGRVRETTRVNGEAVNDDPALEREAEEEGKVGKSDTIRPVLLTKVIGMNDIIQKTIAVRTPIYNAPHSAEGFLYNLDNKNSDRSDISKSADSDKGFQASGYPTFNERGHLIASELGGNGSTENWVTLTDGTNAPGMAYYETKLASHIKEYDLQNIYYKVTTKGNVGDSFKFLKPITFLGTTFNYLLLPETPAYIYMQAFYNSKREIFYAKIPNGIIKPDSFYNMLSKLEKDSDMIKWFNTQLPKKDRIEFRDNFLRPPLMQPPSQGGSQFFIPQQQGMYQQQSQFNPNYYYSNPTQTPKMPRQVSDPDSSASYINDILANIILANESGITSYNEEIISKINDASTLATAIYADLIFPFSDALNNLLPSANDLVTTLTSAYNLVITLNSHNDLTRTLDRARTHARNLADALQKPDPHQSPTQHPDPSSIHRNPADDHTFPLDAVSLLNHRAGRDGDVPETAILHIGPYADEMTRAVHALAITEGRDVYFRSGVYQSADETGQAVLRHELVHVGQFEKEVITYNVDTQEREREAIAAEGRGSQAIVEVRVRGQTFRVPLDALPLVKRLCVKRLREWLASQKEQHPPNEYRRLLVSASRL